MKKLLLTLFILFILTPATVYAGEASIFSQPSYEEQQAPANSHIFMNLNNQKKERRKKKKKKKDKRKKLFENFERGFGDYNSERMNKYTNELNNETNNEQNNEVKDPYNKTNFQKKKKRKDVSENFQKIMDNFEGFFNEYIIFVKKLRDPSSTENFEEAYNLLLEKYTTQLQELAELNTENLTANDISYYVETNARIIEKLTNLAYYIKRTNIINKKLNELN